MMMQMPVVLLIKAMRPVSLFRTMLTDTTGTGATTVGTVGYWSIAVLLLLLLLVLLKMEVMLLLVMGMRQSTASCHTQLLLLMATD